MADDQNTKTLISQIIGDAKKAKRDALKARLKGLYADYLKADEVRASILGEMQKVVTEAGEVGSVDDLMED